MSNLFFNTSEMLRKNMCTIHYIAIAFTICFSSVLVNEVKSQAADRFSLQTSEGIFIGTREGADPDRSPRIYYSFKGIPYAKPPIGELRWTEPELLELKGETMHTLVYGSPCAQWSKIGNRTTGNENCLFLNVFTPSIPVGGGRPGSVPVSSRALLPVMVYFHGGGFMYGSADSAGPRRFMKQDIILVTVNYRLGVLGYLSTADEVIPGNFGSLDQIIALKWVQSYIRGFGGNPSRITIVGHSSGAAAVHQLMLSPRTQGLFHAAIIQSGSALCDWAVEENPAEYAEQIAEAVQCSGSSEEMLECMSKKPVEELIAAQQSFIQLGSLPIRTAPVVDADWRTDPFLPATPEELMDTGRFAKVPVITGVTRDEGLNGYASLHLQEGNENFKDQDYFDNEMLPKLLSLSMDNDEHLDVILKAVKHQYFEGIDVENDTKLVIGETVALMGDLMFYRCHWNMLERFSVHSTAPVYSYIFTHKTPKSPSMLSRQINTLRQQQIQHSLFDYGVPHGEELFYFFEPFNQYPGNINQKLQPVDDKVAEFVTKIWATFASAQSPADAVKVPWRPIKQGNINYYNLTSIPAPMGEDFRKGEALFWLRTVPYLRELGEDISDLEPYPLLFWIFLSLFILFLIITIVLGVVLWRKRYSQNVTL